MQTQNPLCIRENTGITHSSQTTYNIDGSKKYGIPSNKDRAGPTDKAECQPLQVANILLASVFSM